MNSLQNSDTICAIATAPGAGAISVIRLSGKTTFEICDKIVKNKRISVEASHTVHFCRLLKDNNIIDEVLISIFKNPNSYTGEDVAEISCHGSVYIQQQIMELLISNGARMAQPGEFTLRAFLNGKMDLSQAEAVADLIASSSESSHHAAINQMRGGFSKEISALRDQLLNFASLIELELDFSEEDVQFADRNDLKNKVIYIQNNIEKLIRSFKYGNVIKQGFPVAIVGKPNVGKSTLLNMLLNDEKAIVSDIPGTTRDVIEDIVVIEGHLFRFIDTAGIRHTNDTIESMGIERTFDNIKKASVVLLLCDAAESKEDIIQQLEGLQLHPDQTIAIVLNKIDKIEGFKAEARVKELAISTKNDIIPISAKFGDNILLHNFLIKVIRANQQQDSNVIVTNMRHFEALQHSFEAGQRVIDGIENNISGDLLSQDIREMLHYLGTITGEISTDEILGNIFKNFCIGK